MTPKALNLEMATVIKRTPAEWRSFWKDMRNARNRQQQQAEDQAAHAAWLKNRRSNPYDIPMADEGAALEEAYQLQQLEIQRLALFYQLHEDPRLTLFHQQQAALLVEYQNQQRLEAENSWIAGWQMPVELKEELKEEPSSDDERWPSLDEKFGRVQDQLLRKMDAKQEQRGKAQLRRQSTRGVEAKLCRYSGGEAKLCR